MSMDTRVPGVPDGSIAARVSWPVCMSSRLSKYCKATAVSWLASKRNWIAVAGRPGGGPSPSSIRDTSASTRSWVASVNLTTRTYTGVPPCAGLAAALVVVDHRRALEADGDREVALLVGRQRVGIG